MATYQNLTAIKYAQDLAQRQAQYTAQYALQPGQNQLYNNIGQSGVWKPVTYTYGVNPQIPDEVLRKILDLQKMPNPFLDHEFEGKVEKVYKKLRRLAIKTIGN